MIFCLECSLRQCVHHFFSINLKYLPLSLCVSVFFKTSSVNYMPPMFMESILIMHELGCSVIYYGQTEPTVDPKSIVLT